MPVSRPSVCPVTNWLNSSTK